MHEDGGPRGPNQFLDDGVEFGKRETGCRNPGEIDGENRSMDAKTRKNLPVTSGVLDYFPDALLAIAEVSRVGNEQHNPGQPLHWAKEKSTDEADALLRHLIDRGTLDSDGMRHTAKVAWRALALLQREIEEDKECERWKDIYAEPDNKAPEEGYGDFRDSADSWDRHGDLMDWHADEVEKNRKNHPEDYCAECGETLPMHFNCSVAGTRGEACCFDNCRIVEKHTHATLRSGHE